MSSSDVSSVYASAFREFAGLAPASSAASDQLDAFVRRESGDAFCASVVHAVQRSGDRDLGFRFGTAIGGRGMGLLGLAVATAPTLAQSLASLARWEPLVGTIGQLRAERRGDQVRMQWHAPASVPSTLAEGLLGGWIAIGRFLTGERLPITMLEFAHPRGAPSEAESLLACPVRFGGTANVVTVPAEILEARPRYADAPMHAALSHWFDECLEVLTARNSALLRCAGEAILTELPQGGRLEHRVADQLGIALRTLQRRCRASGIGFLRLRDLLRANLAVCRLARSDRRCVDISQQLGFEEQASFSRAVRQWTGHSPREVARLFTGDYAALRRPACRA